jgi:hypothetical protein
VIIDDLDLITITILPDKTDTDLIIDPDAMLSLSVSLIVKQIYREGKLRKTAIAPLSGRRGAKRSQRSEDGR